MAHVSSPHLFDGHMVNWLWDANTQSRIDSTVRRMGRTAMGHCKPAEEGWMLWHTRTLRQAFAWVEHKLGRSYSNWFLRQRTSKWSEWLFAARYKRESELAMSCGLRQDIWRRRRIGRPPRKWEAPIVAMGMGWMRGTHRPVEALCAAI